MKKQLFTNVLLFALAITISFCGKLKDKVEEAGECINITERVASVSETTTVSSYLSDLEEADQCVDTDNYVSLIDNVKNYKGTLTTDEFKTKTYKDFTTWLATQ